MREINGTIENWAMLGKSIFGQIYNDTKGRFKDGHEVRLSCVLTNEENIKEGNIIETLNSVYLLGKRISNENS